MNRSRSVVNDRLRNTTTPDSALCLSTSSGIYSPNVMTLSGDSDSHGALKPPYGHSQSRYQGYNPPQRTGDWFLMGGTERTLTHTAPRPQFHQFTNSKSIPNILTVQRAHLHQNHHHDPQLRDRAQPYQSKSMEMMLQSGEFDPLEEELIGGDILREFEAVCNELERDDIPPQKPYLSQGSILGLTGFDGPALMRGNSLPYGALLVAQPAPSYNHSVTPLNHSLSSIPHAPLPSSHLDHELERLMQEAEMKLQHYISEENIAGVKGRMELEENPVNVFNERPSLPLEFMHRVSFISDTDYMETWLTNNGMQDLRHDRPLLADTDECTLRTTEVDSVSAISQRVTRTKLDADVFSLIAEELESPPAPEPISTSYPILHQIPNSDPPKKKKRSPLSLLCSCAFSPSK